MEGLSATLQAPGVVDVSVYVKPGIRTLALHNNTSRHGHVVATGLTGPEALRCARAAAACLSVRIAESSTQPTTV
ncbi:MAG: hypothetical protein ACT4NY_26715 [Pseudonocardiales bacterium]